MHTPIDLLYKEYLEIDAFLESKGEVSYQISIREIYKKSLLLSTASYFETFITGVIREYVEEITNSNKVLTEFIKRKAIARQYHTYFDWQDPKKGANSFFSMFGSEFSTFIKEIIKADDSLENGILAFLKLGSERNLLVHLNFASYNVDLTIGEIYQLYTDAIYFVTRIKTYLYFRTAPVIYCKKNEVAKPETRKAVSERKLDEGSEQKKKAPEKK